jgi:hypothetical protein
MRNLLPKKVEHYKVFADVVTGIFKSMRYGISSIKPRTSAEIAMMRKQIVDWQANEDAGALTTASLSYTTWLPVTYEENTSMNVSSSGYYQCPTRVAPSSVSLGYNYPGGNSQNIIDVNAGGCITRINLNPTVNINNTSTGSNSQFVYQQTTASTTWTINHGLGFIPNVYTIDNAGVNIIGTIDSSTVTTLVISFSKPVSGYAYLS